MIDLDEFFSDFPEEEYVRLTEEHFKEMGKYCKDNNSDKYADMKKGLASEKHPEICFSLPPFSATFMKEALNKMGENVKSSYSDYDIRDDYHMYIGSLQEYSKVFFELIIGYINKNSDENLREFFDRRCEYSGTQEQINDWTQESIKELDPKTESYFDDCMITNYDGSEILGGLDDFVNIFWDKAIEGILNVVATES